MVRILQTGCYPCILIHAMEVRMDRVPKVLKPAATLLGSSPLLPHRTWPNFLMAIVIVPAQSASLAAGCGSSKLVEPQIDLLPQE